MMIEVHFDIVAVYFGIVPQFRVMIVKIRHLKKENLKLKKKIVKRHHFSYTMISIQKFRFRCTIFRMFGNCGNGTIYGWSSIF